ncbi:MAG: hypothetical protein WCI37_00305 [bacterium]|jgi:hypothetical protein
MSESRVMASDYPNIDVFYNDASTNAKDTLALVQKRFDKWDGGPRIEYHKTSANIDDFKDILINAVENKDGETITGAISGDGSINNIMQIMQDPDTPEVVKNSPLWTPGGGNAVNLFRALTHRIHDRHPDEVIRTGEIDEFFPLNIKTYTEDGMEDEKLAATIFSVGAIAMAASYLNHEEHRNSKIRNRKGGEIIADPIQILHSLKDSEQFLMNDQDHGVRNVFDNIYINSPWNAKIMYARNVKLTGPAYNFEVRQKNTKEVVTAMAKLALGKDNGSYLEDQRSFTVLSDNIMAQVDGEAWEIEADTVFDVGYANEPIKVVTTLKNP